MSSRFWVAVALAACGGSKEPTRTRVLAKLPADATAIVAADARALASPRFRPLVDVLRPDLPAGLDCVVDAALVGDQLAAGLGPSGALTIAITTRAPVACPALSQIEDGLWVATLGSTLPAAGTSVLTAEEHARARPYLLDAPVAAMVARRGYRVLATAQPQPLAAWVAIDAADGAAAERLADTLRATLHEATAVGAIAPVAKWILIERAGSQVVVRLDGSRITAAGEREPDLAVALRTAFERAFGSVPMDPFPCPAPAPPVVGCSRRACATVVGCAVETNDLAVPSLAAAVELVAGARKEAVVVNGRVEGVRLRDDVVPLGLRAGDVLVAIDGQRLTSIAQVTPLLQASRTRASLIVSRLRRFGTIEIAER